MSKTIKEKTKELDELRGIKRNELLRKMGELQTQIEILKKEIEIEQIEKGMVKTDA